mmetsp:Transcript_34383/g.47629  ORF Transcript_34383/g.47629 Transcript_34383/m.47629 type:complete len:684 (+) Transcript_34383:640-2691(+)
MSENARYTSTLDAGTLVETDLLKYLVFLKYLDVDSRRLILEIPKSLIRQSIQAAAKRSGEGARWQFMDFVYRVLDVSGERRAELPSLLQPAKLLHLVQSPDLVNLLQYSYKDPDCVLLSPSVVADAALLSRFLKEGLALLREDQQASLVEEDASLAAGGGSALEGPGPEQLNRAARRISEREGPLRREVQIWTQRHQAWVLQVDAVWGAPLAKEWCQLAFETDELDFQVNRQTSNQAGDQPITSTSEPEMSREASLHIEEDVTREGGEGHRSSGAGLHRAHQALWTRWQALALQCHELFPLEGKNLLAAQGIQEPSPSYDLCPSAANEDLDFVHLGASADWLHISARPQLDLPTQPERSEGQDLANCHELQTTSGELAVACQGMREDVHSFLTALAQCSSELGNEQKESPLRQEHEYCGGHLSRHIEAPSRQLSVLALRRTRLEAAAAHGCTAGARRLLGILLSLTWRSLVDASHNALAAHLSSVTLTALPFLTGRLDVDIREHIDTHSEVDSDFYSSEPSEAELGWPNEESANNEARKHQISIASRVSAIRHVLLDPPDTWPLAFGLFEGRGVDAEEEVEGECRGKENVSRGGVNSTWRGRSGGAKKGVREVERWEAVEERERQAEQRGREEALGESMCPICWSERKKMAFQCGHCTCMGCASTLSLCCICRQPITLRLELF